MVSPVRHHPTYNPYSQVSLSSFLSRSTHLPLSYHLALGPSLSQSPYLSCYSTCLCIQTRLCYNPTPLCINTISLTSHSFSLLSYRPPVRSHWPLLVCDTLPVSGLPACEDEELGAVRVLPVIGHGHGAHAEVFYLWEGFLIHHHGCEITVQCVFNSWF
jgi:hypothetical protein